jgi:hypothetical protein
MRRSRGTPRRALTAILLTAFALVLAISPIFHHDFECHLKSPTHCPACLASPLALGHPAVQGLAAVCEAPSDACLGACPRAPESPLLAVLKDRSPPA